MDFQHYIEARTNPSAHPEGREAIREINIIITQALSRMPRINGFGINDIAFDLITEERASQGLQLNLEVKGSAIAKNKEHINGMLQRLMAAAREPLWQKKIFLEIMYHNIQAEENVHEEDNTAQGLKRTLYFNTIGAAIIFV